MSHFRRSVPGKIHFQLSCAGAASALAGLVLFWAGIPRVSCAAEAAALRCVLVEKEGKVEISRKGTAVWTTPQANEKLEVGDKLRTGLRSRATLRWSELSTVRVSELTSMELQPPAKSTDKPRLELRSGATYFFSREKPTEIQFHTPVASGAIRGT